MPNQKLTSLALVCLCCTHVLAQDGHYWTQQYGTKSLLLSGSVIGGVQDLGAVYYNPARLSLVENPAFLLSASVYEYTTLSISDAFGTAKDASKSEIRGVPTLAAGTFKIKKLPKHHFAYGILTRQNADGGFGYRNEVNEDVFTTLPGKEWFGAEVSLTQQANEQWIGLTWAYNVGEKTSIGVTTNFTTSKQNKGSTISLQVLDSLNQVGIYRYARSFSFLENGLLWKIGLAHETEKWHLGLTVTTPVVSLGGKGSYKMEEFFSTVPGISSRPEAFTTSYQNGLETKYRSPWSVGVGVTRLLGKNKIHLSAEWFTDIPTYTMMSATPHVSQSTPTDTIGFYLRDNAKTIINAGIGVEFYISSHISGYASFSTDYAAAKNDIARFAQRVSEVNYTTWNADFFHTGGGVVIDLKAVDITLGATHVGGKQTVPRLITFPNNPGDPIFSGDTATLEWDRWRLVFSFSFPFLADYAKKLEGGAK